MAARNATRPGGRLRVSRVPRPLRRRRRRRQKRYKSRPLPPLLFLGILPRAPLLLTLTRSLREPQPLPLVMKGFHAQDLKRVPRAKMRKVQVPPRQHLPFAAVAEIL